MTHRLPPQPVTALQPDSAAAQALTESRERMARWLAQDRAGRDQPSLASWTAGAVWPVLRGLGQHPSVPLVLGAWAQDWLRPVAHRQGPRTSAAAVPMEPVGGTLSQVRRHPKTALLLVCLVGAAWLSIRANRHSDISPPR